MLLGALYVPTDGLGKAVRAIEAQLRLARSRGVRVLERHEVLSVRTENGRVTGVVTDRGELDADIVVCCAGIWGPRIARMVGMRLPLTPLAHQFVWSSPLPELAGATGEATRPILRHQTADLYLRERGDQLGVGYYGHEPMPVDADDIASIADAPIMPSIQDFTPGDFEPGWTEAEKIIPALRSARVEEGMNGLFSFTPDNMPLIGESAQVKGFWVAEAVWVTHSAGVARALAEWLVDGYCSSFDLHECDVNRFEQHQLSPAYLLAKDCQNYVEVYDILHPLEPMLKPRPMRTSPFYPRQVELGAYFLEAAGMGASTVVRGERGSAGTISGGSAERVGGDALVAHRRGGGPGDARGVALYDMTTLKRLEITGPGATALLQWLTTGNVDTKVGR